MGELEVAQARQALVQVAAEGWAVGPPATPDGWRSAVRAEARRAGLRVRTGIAPTLDGERPWVATLECIEAWRVVLGGMTLDTFGAAVVAAAVERARKGPAPRTKRNAGPSRSS